MESDLMFSNFPESQEMVDLKKLIDFGFRFGKSSIHTSRTIMVQELTLLFQACPAESTAEDYLNAIIQNNCLGKQTLSSRKLTAQRMRELYGLNPDIPVFRIMRHFWEMDDKIQPLFAILLALSRDAVLRISAKIILELKPGQELVRQNLTSLLSENFQDRLNEKIIDKVVRNTSSSWTQSGHLEGRVRKIRQRIKTTPVVATFALVLGYFVGLRGESLFDTFWTQILDLSKSEMQKSIIDAKRMGLLDISQAGGVVTISINNLLTENERLLLYGTN